MKKQKHDFGFCDIQNNEGLGNGYQPRSSPSAAPSVSVLERFDRSQTEQKNIYISSEVACTDIQLCCNSFTG